MRYAIFSDIHNDAQALAAVLNHADTQNVDAYFCLGDVGIDDCVNLVGAVGAPTVFGNWEASNWRYLSAENRRWALSLPAVRQLERFWLTHAGLFWPPQITTLADLTANPHVAPGSRLFPYLHTESEALWQTFAALAQAKIPLLFHGHTHRQVIWRLTADNRLQKAPQRAAQLQPGDTLVVGVGSVGRPLDGPGAAYAIFDAEAGLVELTRVNK